MMGSLPLEDFLMPFGLGKIGGLDLGILEVGPDDGGVMELGLPQVRFLKVRIRAVSGMKIPRPDVGL